MHSSYCTSCTREEHRQWNNRLAELSAFTTTWILISSLKFKWTTYLKNHKHSFCRPMIWTTRVRSRTWELRNTLASTSSSSIKSSQQLIRISRSSLRTPPARRTEVWRSRLRRSLGRLAVRAQSSNLWGSSRTAETSSSSFGSSYHLASTNQYSNPSSKAAVEFRTGINSPLIQDCYATRITIKR